MPASLKTTRQKFNYSTTKVCTNYFKEIFGYYGDVKLITVWLVRGTGLFAIRRHKLVRRRMQHATA